MYYNLKNRITARIEDLQKIIQKRKKRSQNCNREILGQVNTAKFFSITYVLIQVIKMEHIYINPRKGKLSRYFNMNMMKK